MSNGNDFDKLFSQFEDSFAQAEKNKGRIASLGCVGLAFVAIFNLAFLGLVVWGVVEFILFLTRH